MVDRQNDIVFLMHPWHTVNPSYHNFISMSTRILKEDWKGGRREGWKTGRVEGWKGEKFPSTISQAGWIHKIRRIRQYSGRGVGFHDDFGTFNPTYDSPYKSIRLELLTFAPYRATPTQSLTYSVHLGDAINLPALSNRVFLVGTDIALS